MATSENARLDNDNVRTDVSRGGGRPVGQGWDGRDTHPGRAGRDGPRSNFGGADSLDRGRPDREGGVHGRDPRAAGHQRPTHYTLNDPAYRPPAPEPRVQRPTNHFDNGPAFRPPAPEPREQRPTQYTPNGSAFRPEQHATLHQRPTRYFDHQSGFAGRPQRPTHHFDHHSGFAGRPQRPTNYFNHHSGGRGFGGGRGGFGGFGPLMGMATGLFAGLGASLGRGGLPSGTLVERGYGPPQGYDQGYGAPQGDYGYQQQYEPPMQAAPPPVRPPLVKKDGDVLPAPKDPRLAPKARSGVLGLKDAISDYGAALQNGDIAGAADRRTAVASLQISIDRYSELTGEKFDTRSPENTINSAIAIGNRPDPKFQGQATSSARRDSVSELQRALKRYGQATESPIDLGNSGREHNGIDGMRGPRTNAAVERVKAELGITEKIDAQTLTGAIDQRIDEMNRGQRQGESQDLDDRMTRLASGISLNAENPLDVRGDSLSARPVRTAAAAGNDERARA